MAVKPAEIFGLAVGTLNIGQPADIAVFDLNHEEKLMIKICITRSEYTFHWLVSQGCDTDDLRGWSVGIQQGGLKR